MLNALFIYFRMDARFGRGTCAKLVLRQLFHAVLSPPICDQRRWYSHLANAWQCRRPRRREPGAKVFVAEGSVCGWSGWKNCGHWIFLPFIVWGGEVVLCSN